MSKIIVILILLIIVWSLGSSFYFLIREQGKGVKTVRILTWRIGLSLLLFILLYVMFAMGWIEPSSPGPIGLRPADGGG